MGDSVHQTDFHIEVKIKNGTRRIEAFEDQLQSAISNYFYENLPLLCSVDIFEVPITDDFGDLVHEFVESITIERDSSECALDNIRLVYHIYRPHIRGAEVECFEDDQDQEVPASNHWLLPTQSFAGLWESLIYEKGLKEDLLHFSESLLLFSEHNVSKNIIACNKILLLHGPPGTGKTSLCKAIAQKLSIRLDSNFKYTHLIEINSHSLFSKWFSESGKLVMKLFTKVREIVAQPKSLVCVLIDEVESIAYSRNSMSSQEPKDALRVVNALLTQLDSLKEFPNVLVLVTSNLASSIDAAFLDRADMRQYIGLPSQKGIYQIYISMIKELMRVRIIHEEHFPLDDKINESLMALADMSSGLSGRSLRKIPFTAHALYLFNHKRPIDLSKFIESMKLACNRFKLDSETQSLNES